MIYITVVISNSVENLIVYLKGLLLKQMITLQNILRQNISGTKYLTDKIKYLDEKYLSQTKYLSDKKLSMEYLTN